MSHVRIGEDDSYYRLQEAAHRPLLNRNQHLFHDSTTMQKKRAKKTSNRRSNRDRYKSIKFQQTLSHVVKKR